MRRGNAVLSHGTLLLHSDLETLRKSLSPDKSPYIKRSVRSNIVEVTNLFDHIKKISENDIIRYILDYFERVMNFKIFY